MCHKMIIVLNDIMLSDFILLVILIVIMRSVVRVSVVEESKYVIVLVCVKHFLPSLKFPGNAESRV
jgi:hypothetical protein